MVQNNKKQQKTFARRLRRQGLSYSEIQKHVSIPKSTLSTWLNNITMTPEQIKRLVRRRREGAKRGGQKKIFTTQRMIERIQEGSRHDIKKISDKEFWLMGVMLYWRERLANDNDRDLYRGVQFSTSDSDVAKFFLKWLLKIGKLKKNEVLFDIFLKENLLSQKEKIVKFWSNTTGFSESSFTKIYYQKSRRKKVIRKTREKSKNGILRIRVRSSSMLARQLNGWARGIKEKISDV